MDNQLRNFLQQKLQTERAEIHFVLPGAVITGKLVSFDESQVTILLQDAVTLSALAQPIIIQSLTLPTESILAWGEGRISRTNEYSDGSKNQSGHPTTTRGTDSGSEQTDGGKK
jgi:hypothetical protein